jgi:hypothetical protein
VVGGKSSRKRDRNLLSLFFLPLNSVGIDDFLEGIALLIGVTPLMN